MAGRPYTLDEAKIEQLAKFVKTGVDIDTAARAVGISPRTFYNYKADAKAMINNEIRVREFSEEYIELLSLFIERVMKAEAEAEIEMAQVVVDAASTDWKAALEWLSRRHPERWGKKQSTEHRHVHLFEQNFEDDVIDVRALTVEELELLASGAIEGEFSVVEGDTEEEEEE